MAHPKKLPDEEKRSFKVGVRFNLLELQRLERKLAYPGLVKIITKGSLEERKKFRLPSEYLRAAALGEKIPPAVPEVNRLTYIELQRIGNNINQIARVLHQIDAQSDAGFLVNDLKDDVRNFAEKVIGLRDAFATAVPAGPS